MNTLLEQELAPLNARIEKLRGTLREHEGELRATEAELETFSADRQRFDALREACNLLERLEQLEAGQLFWGELPECKDSAGHMARLRSRIAVFDQEIGGVLEKQAHLKAQLNQGLDELDYLYDEVHETYARDERREEELAIVREISPVPDHELIMPWSDDADVERRYRRTMSTALLLSILLTIITRLVIVPEPVRPPVVEVPERLAMMVRKEHKKPVPVKKSVSEKKAEKKEEKVEEKKQTAKAQEKPVQERAKPAAAEPVPAPAAAAAAPRKAQDTGVLKFKDAFKDLIDDAPVARLGAEARLANPATHAAGQTQASRSLVSIQGGGGGGAGSGAISRNVGSGGSGGIGSAGVSRSVGGGGGKGDRLGRGGDGFAQVKSGIAGSGSGTKEARPLSSGARPARTDEEIQILFDRYKAALYRIYNTKLREDPTLRGKMVLRIAIEPSGVVSACSVESTNMDAAEFCSQIVDRVKKINFGPKDGVPKTTILYPIDFLPAR